ncbi:peptidoglycan-binding protein [Oculatella sp. LEGE 06141]|uniref:peptidoglycan-binding protein n=1 Tax=Oculatella sp. LEGE 06141 TaxID=1828648 RepID=UPI0018815A7A|nr:peptidoglycan-binding protein [Oculatella sp. LEGE 06141]MBE9181257.1 peptidoglycan-binding protein [Oculatella sp. LEGE 06141]
MSHRSNLLLVTCVTCFGFAPSPAISQAVVLDDRVGAVKWAAVQADVFPNDALQLDRVVADRSAVAQAISQTVSDRLRPGSVELATAQVPLLTDEAADLKAGSQGQRVAELQAMLQELGYYEAVADGVYGQGTVVAVRAFQTANGLSATGEADPVTWERLQQALVSSLSAEEAVAAEPAPSPAAASPEAISAADTDSTNPSASASAQPGWLWWVFVGLGVAVLGGGCLYGISRLLRPTPERKPDRHKPAHLPAKPPDPLPEDQRPPLLSESDRNGYTEPPAEPEPDPADAPESSALTAETPALSETTRLSRIDIVEELIKDLNSPDPRKRRKAVWELGQRGDSKAIQPLVDLMIDSDSTQRSLILASVSEIAVRALKPMNRALFISLQDESSEVRKNAIRDLTRVYEMLTQASQFLRHAVEDSDKEVQDTARWALGQLNRIRTAPENDNLPPSLPNSNLPNSNLPNSNLPKDHLSGDVSDSN